MEVFIKERKDVLGLGVPAEHRFREDQLTVEVNVEDPARPGNNLDSVDRLLPFLDDARNQTGRVGQRASGNAVLDPDAMPHGHRTHRSFRMAARLRYRRRVHQRLTTRHESSPRIAASC